MPEIICSTRYTNFDETENIEKKYYRYVLEDGTRNISYRNTVVENEATTLRADYRDHEKSSHQNEIDSSKKSTEFGGEDSDRDTTHMSGYHNQRKVYEG